MLAVQGEMVTLAEVQPSYQLLPPLRDEEYQALKVDIAKRGILVPVELDEDGNILDGHNRAAIATELGIQYQTVVRHFESEQDKREHVLKINLLRRHLGPVGWAEAFRRLAEVRGVRLGTGGGPRPNGSNCPTVGQLAEELGVPKATAYRRLSLADELAPTPDLAAKVDSGEMEAKRALRIKREREETRVEALPLKPLPASAKLLLGDFRAVQIEAGSIDVIICDPPYPREYLPLYGDLAAVAARSLRPGGSCLVMVGQSYLPDILASMTRHLRYHWTLAYLTPGGQSPQIWPRKVNTFWKPVLWFVNGDYDGNWIGDVAKSAVNDNDKRFHDWGQSESGMADLVERFSKPGDLILDPFCGGGTTGVVAMRLGRRFIGIDSDEQAIKTTERRLAEAVVGDSGG